MSQNRRLGQSGEDLTAQWYIQNGYEIVDRNWRAGRLGEVDIVARAAGVLVICEVKTRTSDRFGQPGEAVTLDKQQRLRQLGARYVSEHHLRVTSVRFDVAAVMGGVVNVLQDAF